MNKKNKKTNIYATYCCPWRAFILIIDAKILSGNEAKTTNAICQEAENPKARATSNVKIPSICFASASPYALCTILGSSDS
jgi:hypothetical protein